MSFLNEPGSGLLIAALGLLVVGLLLRMSIAYWSKSPLRKDRKLHGSRPARHKHQ